MDIFIQILNYVGAVWIVLAIYLIGKNCKWWLFYSASNLPFTVVAIYDGRWGFAVMGCVLCVTGIKNYYSKKKKIAVNTEEARVVAEAEILSHLR